LISSGEGESTGERNGGGGDSEKIKVPPALVFDLLAHSDIKFQSHAGEGYGNVKC
jgi:hypothetical protein